MNGQDRMYEKKWGIFTHYLYATPSAPDQISGEPDWNRRIENLDAEQIAETLHSTGAGYYFITLMQGRKYMLAPNATFDRIAGTIPGEACAKRDFVMDLALALKKYDIDLYLYYTGDGPYGDVEVGQKFGFVEPRENVTMDFVQKWASVLEEYAVRYGDLVKGWWIDGCYSTQFNYTPELLRPYYEAVKKGNPNAVVAFNKGLSESLEKWYPDEDFTCGEKIDFTYIPESRFIDGAQAHILAPVGIPNPDNEYDLWCRPGCKRDADYMIDYVRKVNQAGGVVTIDIKIWSDGSFDPEQIEMLQKLGKAIQ